jgi:hypothetical protein
VGSQEDLPQMLWVVMTICHRYHIVLLVQVKVEVIGWKVCKSEQWDMLYICTCSVCLHMGCNTYLLPVVGGIINIDEKNYKHLLPIKLQVRGIVNYHENKIC